MLSLTEIEKFYPDSLKPFGRFLLREYLQYKILEIIYSSEYSDKLYFLGGTCLRIIHGNNRFSEDLDFDNQHLSKSDFIQLSKRIKKELDLQGYNTEIRTVFAGAFHCYISIPGLLYHEKISGHRDEKILIQLDAEPQHFEFAAESPVINRFDVLTRVFTTPLRILLSQKFFTALNRKVPKGRDFYDILFLLSRSEPDYNYLKFKTGISDFKGLKRAILKRSETIDFTKLIKDVSPFLFSASDARRILMFPEIMKQLKEDKPH